MTLLLGDDTPLFMGHQVRKARSDPTQVPLPAPFHVWGAHAGTPDYGIPFFGACSGPQHQVPRRASRSTQRRRSSVPSLDSWHGRTGRVNSIEQQRALIGQILAQEPYGILSEHSFFAESTRYVDSDPLDEDPYHDAQGRFDLEDMEPNYEYYGKQQYTYESRQQSDVSRSYRRSKGLTAELFYPFQTVMEPEPLELHESIMGRWRGLVVRLTV
jgi:hypothetical protein